MKFISYLKKTLPSLLLISGMSHAAVVLNASRIVMEGTTEKTITFDNTSDNPFIVQVEPDNSDKPDFVAMPPVFKIKEKGGQVVKIKLLSDTLPQDKESLFYLNFTQIPGIKKNEGDDNRLNIIIKSHLKIIYRPKSVSGFSEKSEAKVSYEILNGKLVIKNDTPNVLSISDVSYEKRILLKNVTIKPGEVISKSIDSNQVAGPLKAVLINDYGMPVSFIIASKIIRK